jgi:hypothetical protein
MINVPINGCVTPKEERRMSVATETILEIPNARTREAMREADELARQYSARMASIENLFDAQETNAEVSGR